jgi:hypothetical protein
VQRAASFTPACDGHPLAPITEPIVVRGAKPGELAAAGDWKGAAAWRRIMDAVLQLANKTPPGPVH